VRNNLIIAAAAATTTLAATAAIAQARVTLHGAAKVRVIQTAYGDGPRRPPGPRDIEKCLTVLQSTVNRRWAVFYTWGRQSTVQYCLKHNLASNGYALVYATTPGQWGIDAEGDEPCPTRPTATGTVKVRTPLAVGRDLLPQQRR
jgi:hypothetical protein